MNTYVKILTATFFVIGIFFSVVDTKAASYGCTDADIQRDEIVDILDYRLLVQYFFSSSSEADINKDNFVDLSDYAIVIENFFATCPEASPSPSPTSYTPPQVTDGFTLSRIDIQSSTSNTLQYDVSGTVSVDLQTNPDFRIVAYRTNNYVDSKVFVVNGEVVKVDNADPAMLTWTYGTGTFEVYVIPYENADATGASGQWIKIDLTVTGDGTTPRPTPTPSTDPGPIGDTAGYRDELVTTTCPAIPSSGYTAISSTQDWNNRNGGFENEVFVFAPGTYNIEIRPKNGQSFYANGDVTFDGQDQKSHAFIGNTDNVYICGFKITNYTTNGNPQRSAIHGKSGDNAHNNPDELSNNWVIENVEIYNNYGGGIDLGNNSIARNSVIHNNDSIGVKASAATNATYDNVKVSFNSYNNPNDWGHEGGGSKFAETKNLVVRNSYFGFNKGPGIWTDIDNYGTRYEGNLIEHNTSMAIFHEISYDAVITGNLIRDNGLEDTCGNWLFRCAGIYISSSSQYDEIANEADYATESAYIAAAQKRTDKNIEIYNNVVIGNRNGITGTPDGRRTVGNMDVHDNVVINSGSSGVSNGGSPNTSLFSTIKFYNNCYQNSSQRPFDWKGGQKNWNEWLATGNGSGSKLNPIGGCQY